MTGPQTSANNGSMDDILASIRRIIAEDAPATGQQKANPSVMPRRENILELTKVVRDDGSIIDLNAIRAAQHAQESRVQVQPQPQPQQIQPQQIQPPPASHAQPTAPASSAPLTRGQPIFQSAPQFGTAPAAPPPPLPPKPVAAPQAQAGMIASGETAKSVGEAFQNLKQSMRQSAAKPEEQKPMVGGRTIEDLALDLMRPMLKSWLDANLAPLVQKAVEKEIQRIRESEAKS